ncbi:hypothetical protein [Methylomonas sp. DH-1]|uniref:hypothetical protein n=1 Tax=Methylomonas sp. (strain DH-1) TaxID=1727196 RepID=UPI0007C88699|nr:hypothetical protein [Methylomonas sp. DH-1]ANE54049.1 hypothetical protein AYM39_01845 [Methylomonas sp. DH-1]
MDTKLVGAANLAASRRFGGTGQRLLAVKLNIRKDSSAGKLTNCRVRDKPGEYACAVPRPGCGEFWLGSGLVNALTGGRTEFLPVMRFQEIDPIQAA